MISKRPRSAPGIGNLFKHAGPLLCLLLCGSQALASAPDEQAITALIETLENSDDLKSQIDAAKKLSANGNENAVLALGKAVRSGSDALATACLSALARHHKGRALELSLQCMSAPKNHCSAPMKAAATKTAKKIWKKTLRAKGAFPKATLRINLETDVHDSIDKKDRWARHFHAELFTAIMADANIEMGEEVDLFSDDTDTETWTPKSGIPLKITGTVQSIKRKGKSGGNFQYTVKLSGFNVVCPAFKAKAKRIKPMSSVAASEDESSLETRIIKLALTQAAQELATKLQIWSRGRSLTDPSDL